MTDQATALTRRICKICTVGGDAECLFPACKCKVAPKIAEEIEQALAPLAAAQKACAEENLALEVEQEVLEEELKDARQEAKTLRDAHEAQHQEACRLAAALKRLEEISAAQEAAEMGLTVENIHLKELLHAAQSIFKERGVISRETEEGSFECSICFSIVSKEYPHKSDCPVAQIFAAGEDK